MNRLYFTIIFILLFFSGNYYAQNIPDSFVEIREVIPDIVLDLRYAANHNFLGVPVNGYNAEKCFITKAAADSLLKVQNELKQFNLSLKVYDAYRPQRAVDHFVRWAEDLSDTLTKKEFYSTLDKDRLFIDGYIAKKSGHSRGSTIDLTIVPIPLPYQPVFDIENQCECFKSYEERFKDNSIDMGTGFDCFHQLSHTLNKDITAQQKANRLLLKTLMEKYGFKNLAEEWWHFTLKNEPFPTTYFDFEIK
ncbi:MAG: M15 family metallopeptidase [Ignavibacteriaceae bacterium]|jgi:D-alanyl-D-alanine dipeptidase|nr:M15 family metallopeptidase [Ignavibacteriaceae bacterium]